MHLYLHEHFEFIKMNIDTQLIISLKKTCPFPVLHQELMLVAVAIYGGGRIGLFL